jgi:phosphorylated CTD-interacting factor 1
MIKHLKVSVELFASPMNHYLDNYLSPYNDTDAYFGSKGNFFEVYPGLLAQGGSFQAHPPSIEYHLAAFSLIILPYLTLDKPLSFIIFAPLWKDAVFYQILMNTKFNVLSKKFIKLYKDAHMISGHSNHGFKNVEKRSARDNCIFILQNEAGKIEYPVTEEFINELTDSFKR